MPPRKDLGSFFDFESKEGIDIVNYTWFWSNYTWTCVFRLQVSQLCHGIPGDLWKLDSTTTSTTPNSHPYLTALPRSFQAQGHSVLY